MTGLARSGVAALQPAVAVAGSYVRPADTTAYAALDAVSDSTSAPTVLTFADMGRFKGGYGLIGKAQLQTDQKTCVARFRLHLFSVAPTAINDNSPYLTLWANRASKIGAIDFAACGTEDPTGSTSAGSVNTSTTLQYVCDGADTGLYGLLETLDAFTPASGQSFFVKLTAEQG